MGVSRTGELGYLFHTAGDIFSQLATPWHTGLFQKGSLTSKVKITLLNVSKITLWIFSTLYAFHEETRIALNRTFSATIHPSIPLTSLITTLFAGIFLKKIGVKLEEKSLTKQHVGQKSTKLSLSTTSHRVELSKGFKPEDMKNALLGNHPDKLRKDIVKPLNCIYPPIAFDYMVSHIGKNDFENTLQIKLKPAQLHVISSKERQSYTTKEASYLLPGKKCVGRTFSFLDDWESIEFPALALVEKYGTKLYATVEQKTPPFGTPNAIVIPNAKRYTKVKRESVSHVKDSHIASKWNPFGNPEVRLICLNGVAWHGEEDEIYTVPILKYQLHSLVTAFLSSGPKGIHANPWSCGVVGNSKKMMIALKILAAAITEKPLVIHNIKEEAFDPIKKEMENWLSSKTPLEILKELELKQKNDASWKPNYKS